MEKRNIKREFLAVPDYYINEDKKEIDEDKFIKDIETIDATMIAMVICYSQLLDLRFLLESKGIFSETRMNRDICLQSRGQILTMSETQKKLLQTVAQPENIEKNVWIEGQVGSGKTLMGLEVVKMKVAHYIRKYGFNAEEGKENLRVIVAFEEVGVNECKILKNAYEIELLEDIGKQSTIEIHSEFEKFDWAWWVQLEKIITMQKNFTKFQKTIIFIDESATSMIKTAKNLKEKIAIEYIYCMRYNYLGRKIDDDVKTDDDKISCQLMQCQRSSQQILNLGNFIVRHEVPFSEGGKLPIPIIHSKESFYGHLPKWIEVRSTNDFISYATSNMTALTDVMLIYDYYPSEEIKDLCSKMNWKCVSDRDINGSESSVIIILNQDRIHYEALTRAKHELIIVTTVTTQTTKLFEALKQIENEFHNDEQCQRFESRHEVYYGTLPTTCRFKDNPKEIPKLLEKIFIG